MSVISYRKSHIFGRLTIMKPYLSILLTGVTSLAMASGPVKEEVAKRDTVQAVVMYGEELLFDAVDGLSDVEVSDLRDSIMKFHGANELTNYINLYLNLKNKTEEELTLYIDSLFEAEGKVPYALINQINIFLANRPEDLPEMTPEDVFIGLNNYPYPAMDFYPDWVVGTPNPYKNDMWQMDTAFSLLLAGAGNLGEFHVPHNDVLTSKFGWRDGRMHNGIDIDLQVWDTVVAAFPGVVRVARSSGGYGRVVVIRHYNGLETTYAHLHRFKVKEGDVVEGGQLIGLGGSSGHSTGSHLHFEVRFKGVPLNPMSFISFDDRALLNDTLMLKRVKNGFVAYPKGVLFHTVRRGDNLYEIAKQYGTTTNKLAELNGIRRNSYLYVGQRLRVI
ncbi:MAG: M23 family metallopeptidase [Flavobacteriales bacterium]